MKILARPGIPIKLISSEKIKKKSEKGPENETEGKKKESSEVKA